MLIQVSGVLVPAMSGTELSRVRTEFRLRPPEPINKSPLESRGAEIVMQSCAVPRREYLTLLHETVSERASWLCERRTANRAKKNARILDNNQKLSGSERRKK
jgi:hypothetical protein